MHFRTCRTEILTYSVDAKESTPPQPQPQTNNNLDEKVFVGEKRALVFLPAKYHILMHFTIYEQHTLVKIYTDFWKALSYIDSYFNIMLEDV